MGLLSDIIGPVRAVIDELEKSLKLIEKTLNIKKVKKAKSSKRISRK